MYALGLSFNFVSLTSILYAYFIVPRTAWTPIGRGVWSGWSVLGRLGIAGIGESKLSTPYLLMARKRAALNSK